jgi:hypothetical protein
MLRIEIRKIDKDLQIADISYIEKGEWVETICSEPIESIPAIRDDFIKNRSRSTSK